MIRLKVRPPPLEISTSPFFTFSRMAGLCFKEEVDGVEDVHPYGMAPRPVTGFQHIPKN